MKKLLGILVTVFVLNIGFSTNAQSYGLAKSYIKQNLERFNELRFSKFGEKCDPAKDKKGDCRVSRSIAKIAERCIGKESWDTWFTSDVERTKKEREEIIKSQCRNVHQYMVRQFAKIENERIEAMFENIPPKNVSIPFQCYYDKNRAWIDYKINLDREFIEYHLFKYRRWLPDKVDDIGIGAWGKLELAMERDTIGASRYFPRFIEQRYDFLCYKCEKKVRAYLITESTQIALNENKIAKWEWKRSHDVSGKKTNDDYNSLSLSESSLEFEFKNQESLKRLEKDIPDEAWGTTSDNLKISLSTGAMQFYQTTKMWGPNGSSSNSDMWNGSCVGIEELYSYIQHVKIYKNKFEELRAKIRSGNRDGEQSGAVSGTAFFINKSGNLLTNQHVVEGCSGQKINYLNKEYDADIIATDKKLDLALLKIKIKPKNYISFARDGPKKLQTIYVAGYPLGKGLSDDLKINDGKINALKGYKNNSNEIQIDAAVNPGNSGGPIVNKQGNLIAIAVAGLSKDVTEGINFGIKSSAARNFLDSNKVKPEKALYSRDLSLGKIVSLLEDTTVYTFCK